MKKIFALLLALLMVFSLASCGDDTGNNENVGWTKRDRACVYNIDVMEEVADNLAVGANAVSKRVFNEKGLITRFASQKDLRTYIENIDTIIEKKRKFFE